jgi:hypothetical protein
MCIPSEINAQVKQASKVMSGEMKKEYYENEVVTKSGKES